MVYVKGDIRVYREECRDADGCCTVDDPAHDCAPSDARGGYERRLPCAALPHSCDEWVIGGPAEIRTLMADLESALADLEKA